MCILGQLSQGVLLPPWRQEYFATDRAMDSSAHDEWSDSDATPTAILDAPLGSLCAVVSLKSTKKAQRALQKTRLRTDAAAYREYAQVLDVQPTNGQTPEAIELAELLREAKRTNIVRRRHEAAARNCARRSRLTR